MQEKETIKAKIEQKMTKVSSFKIKNEEKAKTYNEKHQQRVEDYQSEQKKELDIKKIKIEDKLSKAAERRDEVIEQVKLTAAQSAVLKMSPKKTEQQKE